MMTKRTTCPKCSAARKNKTEKCCTVFDNGNEFCHHCAWDSSKDGRPRVEYKKPSQVLPQGKPGEFMAFLKGRGITAEVAARNKISWNGREILFPYLLGEQIVNIKYRTMDKKFRQEAGAMKIFYGLNDIVGEKDVYVVEGECFPGDVEILTPDGWVLFAKYKNGKVLQVDSNMNGSFVTPSRKVIKEYNGDLLAVSRGGNYFSITTPGHKIVYVHKDGRLIKRAVKDMPKNIPGTIPTVTNINGKGIGLSQDQIALALAISADAAIRSKNYNGRYAVFAFKKSRKTYRLRKLLDRLKIKSSDNPIRGGYTSICFHLPGFVPGRILPWQWITDATRVERDFILKEMVHWDGNSVSNRTQTEYSSNKIQNAVWMQTIAHTSMKMSTVMARSNEYGSWYKVSILNNKNSVSWQGITPEKRPYNDKVYCVTVPTGMILVRQEGKISVSGNCDKLACEVAGYENVVSTPDGAPSLNAKTYTTKFKFIDDCEHLFAAAERVIIAVDNDLPGKKLEAELVRRFDPERCWLVRWPLDCKDANEVLIKHGMVKLMECLENPRQIPIDGVFTSGDYFDLLDSLYEDGLQGGNSTGWAAVDEFYTVRPGEMTIITGIPSHGKSTMLTALMVNLSHQFGWKHSVFSPENQPLQRYMGIIAGMHIGKPFGKGSHERMNKAELEGAKKWMDEYFYFTQPNDDDLTIDSLLSKAKETVKRYGVNTVVLDPWNEIDNTRPAGITETEHINKSLGKVRRFGRLYQVHMFIVAHPQKLQKDNDGKYPAPTAYEISSSAHWYNKADAILSVWRDPKDESKGTVIYVQKVRFREVGKVGEIKMNHDILTGRFSDKGWFESHYKGNEYE